LTAMTAEIGTDEARRSACHGMLLRLAGRIPDDLLWRAREWLAEGAYGDLAQALTFVTVAQGVPLQELDTMYLAELLTAAGEDASLTAEAEITDGDPMPYYEFQPDLPGLDEDDTLDRAAVAVIETASGVRGLWRSWRVPPAGAPWPPPRPIFVVEVGADADPVALTRELQHRLTAEGEAHPQVEVLTTGEMPPTYQQSARAFGELLWAAETGPEIRVAEAFDEVGENGDGRFADDHPRIEDEEERRRVLAYLDSGDVLMYTPARLDDVMAPERTYAVPINFRTDGTWVWNDLTRYYLEEHHLAPDPELLEHIRSAGSEVPELDGVAVYRAMEALRASLVADTDTADTDTADTDTADTETAGAETAAE
jgi:hypothetical protein